MRLTMRERRAVLSATAKRYQQATKRERGAILDEFTHTTRYGRKYAAWVLTNWLRKRVFTIGGCADDLSSLASRRPSLRARTRPSGPRTYGADIAPSRQSSSGPSPAACVASAWRPSSAMWCPILERFEELPAERRADGRNSSRSVPATIDRLLAPERAKYQLERSRHHPAGTLLKHQIPVRTFSDWDEAKPGFMEADLVAQDGGVPALRRHPQPHLDRYCQWLDRGRARLRSQGPPLGLGRPQGHPRRTFPSRSSGLTLTTAVSSLTRNSCSTAQE